MFQGKHSDLTERILAAYHKVYAKLGYGFREKVYRNVLRLELKRSGLEVEIHKPIKVYYDGVVVGSYFADVVVNGLVILELKAVSALLPKHEAQTLNYLKATKVEVALLLNFGPKPEFKRKVYDNDRKGTLSWLPPEAT
jgi:GxxExxY protein